MAGHIQQNNSFRCFFCCTPLLGTSISHILHIAFNCCLTGVKPFPYTFFSILEKLLKKQFQASAQPASRQGIHVEPLTQLSSISSSSRNSSRILENVNSDMSFLGHEIKVRHECYSIWLPMMLHIFISLEDGEGLYWLDFPPSIAPVWSLLTFVFSIYSWVALPNWKLLWQSLGEQCSWHTGWNLLSKKQPANIACHTQRALYVVNTA